MFVLCLGFLPIHLYRFYYPMTQRRFGKSKNEAANDEYPGNPQHIISLLSGNTGKRTAEVFVCDVNMANRIDTFQRIVARHYQNR